MDEKIEKVTNRLIRLYSNGSAKAELKFRAKLESIDWDKEERKLKSSLNIQRILLSIILVLFVLLFVMHIVKHNLLSSTLGAIFAISWSSIALLFNIQIVAQKYEAIKMLRKLLEK